MNIYILFFLAIFRPSALIVGHFPPFLSHLEHFWPIGHFAQFWAKEGLADWVTGVIICIERFELGIIIHFGWYLGTPHPRNYQF